MGPEQSTPPPQTGQWTPALPGVGDPIGLIEGWSRADTVFRSCHTRAVSSWVVAVWSWADYSISCVQLLQWLLEVLSVKVRTRAKDLVNFCVRWVVTELPWAQTLLAQRASCQGDLLRRTRTYLPQASRQGFVTPWTGTGWHMTMSYCSTCNRSITLVNSQLTTQYLTPPETFFVQDTKFVSATNVAHMAKLVNSCNVVKNA